MNYKLALVIPAYKKDYLEATLESIANQTRKDFTVYIGDDSSPYDLSGIVNKFSNKFELHYQRFEENLGSNDLAAHWERCIAMTREEWIWLFSDDDLMDNSCVENFYRNLENDKNSTTSAFHFNCKKINEQNIVNNNYTGFPEEISSEEFYTGRIKNKLQSFVVEFIFKKESYINVNKFNHFPLAWCADDAFWIKLASVGKIVTLPGSYVFWRYSLYNISALNRNIGVAILKLDACKEYLTWADSFFANESIKPQITKQDKGKWFTRQLYLVAKNFNFFKSVKILYTFYRSGNYNILDFSYTILYFTYLKIK